MADYPDITQLSQLDVTTPAGSEVAAKIDDAIRQIKKFLSVYMAVAHNADGTIKNDAVAVATIPDNAVTYAKIQNVSATDKVLGRSTAGAGDIEEIPCTAAGRTLIAALDAAAQRAALGLDTLATKATVTVTELSNDAVETAKIKDLNVTNAKLADGTIQSGKIGDGQVPVAKLGWTGGSDAAPTLMVKGTAAAECTIGGVLTATKVGTVLQFSYAGSTTPGSGSASSTIGYARLEEQRAANTGAGDATATTWVDRTGWIENDPGDFLSVSGANITFKKAGVYLIDLMVPCSGAVGFHRCKLVNNTGPSDIKLGSTSQCAAGVTTYSHLREIITISADNTVLKVQSWSTATVAGTGKGAPSNQGGEEVYSIMEIIKL